ncbi:hypothetical protein L207DRAFT_42153 [Hyaloscypha variabilis F]|uniref:Uncharacterized protein n=1 Tax=Hyaloscypha variabilis (strain UAMH 11265 / GT02V1 / F) TaxID=1149755 RepID=A0A2J6RJF9_HYAVF|nr:hypothetical protein L207DRAFT_42153 [Hyaloscypha variabilis F]
MSRVLSLSIYAIGLNCRLSGTSEEVSTACASGRIIPPFPGDRVLCLLDLPRTQIPTVINHSSLINKLYSNQI